MLKTVINIDIHSQRNNKIYKWNIIKNELRNKQTQKSKL